MPLVQEQTYPCFSILPCTAIDSTNNLKTLYWNIQSSVWWERQVKLMTMLFWWHLSLMGSPSSIHLVMSWQKLNSRPVQSHAFANHSSFNLRNSEPFTISDIKNHKNKVLTFRLHGQELNEFSEVPKKGDPHLIVWTVASSLWVCTFWGCCNPQKLVLPTVKEVVAATCGDKCHVDRLLSCWSIHYYF